MEFFLFSHQNHRQSAESYKLYCQRRVTRARNTNKISPRHGSMGGFGVGVGVFIGPVVAVDISAGATTVGVSVAVSVAGGVEVIVSVVGPSNVKAESPGML